MKHFAYSQVEDSWHQRYTINELVQSINFSDRTWRKQNHAPLPTFRRCYPSRIRWGWSLHISSTWRMVTCHIGIYVDLHSKFLGFHGARIHGFQSCYWWYVIYWYGAHLIIQRISVLLLFFTISLFYLPFSTLHNHRICPTLKLEMVRGKMNDSSWPTFHQSWTMTNHPVFLS